MKMSVKPCPKEKPEPDLEFRLEDREYEIRLKVSDKANGISEGGNILSINKATGKLRRCPAINKEFGLPLDIAGRLEVER